MHEKESSRPAAANIAKVAKLEEQFLEERTTVQRIGDAIGTFVGNMTFVVIHIIVFVAWFVVNSRVVPNFPIFDPYPFILLSMVVSIEGVLLATFVLMKQNRESKRAEHRQQLTLQIDLLAEQEATKTLQMLRSICTHLGIEDAGNDAETKILSTHTAVDELAKELKKNLPPE